MSGGPPGGESSGHLLCLDVEELVVDWVDELLPAPDRGAMETHLRGCEACRIYVAAYRTTIRLVQHTMTMFPGHSAETDRTLDAVAARLGWAR